MSVERRRLMLAYGASFELTPREKGMKGAIERAKELLARYPGRLDAAAVRESGEHRRPREARPRRRSSRTFREGLDYLITGVGTGGHITGCARVLKKSWPDLKVFAVEPTASPVISGGKPSPHPIQGIGAGFIPKNLETELLTASIQVEAEDAKEYARRCAAEEGILVGISSGAALAAIAAAVERHA